MNLAKIRKALVAAAGGAVAAALASLQQAANKGSITRDDIAVALGVAVTAAVTVGLATYAVRNTGLPGGSIPPAAGRPYGDITT